MSDKQDPKEEQAGGQPAEAASPPGPDAKASPEQKPAAEAKAAAEKAPAEAKPAAEKAPAEAKAAGDAKAEAKAEAGEADAKAPAKKAAPAAKAAAPRRPARRARAAKDEKPEVREDPHDVKPGTYPKARSADPDRQKRIEEARARAAAKAKAGGGKAATARGKAPTRRAPAKKKAAIHASQADKPVAPAGGSKAYSRRDFLRIGLWGSAVLFLGQISGSFLDFFWPRRLGAFGSRINLGPVEKFPLDTVTAVEAGKFYLVHVDDGLLAVYWTCTHLGCTVPWEPDKHPEHGGCFCCGCHGSEFSITGDYIGGPAPRPLDLFPVEVIDGEVWVDTGNVVERERYHPDQATPVMA